MPDLSSRSSIDQRTMDAFAKVPVLREERPASLILLHADSLDGLALALDKLEIRLNQSETIHSLAAESAYLSTSSKDTFTLSLIGKDNADLAAEINHARRGLPRAVAAGSEWQTPSGSYFTPAPLGADAGIAFVYPGAFSSYPGMGREIFTAYPEILHHMSTLTSDPWYTLRGDQIYPAGLDDMPAADLSALETCLSADPVAMLSSGTTLAIAITWVLQKRLNLSPLAAFGYSLGESSMLFSLGVWQDGDQAMRELDVSPVFKSRLAGPRQAVQEYWNLDGNTLANWENHILMASASDVFKVISSFPRVYLTHINAPRQIVIGGDPVGCSQLIAALGCPSLRAPFDHVLHCPPVLNELPGLRRMNEWPVWPMAGIKLLTADGYTNLPETSEKIAEGIARMLSNPLDFPRLVRQAYQEGSRIFIEVGAGSNCSRWIDETLAEQPHLAVPTNRRGIGDRSAFLRLAARLASHRIPVSLRILNSGIIIQTR